MRACRSRLCIIFFRARLLRCNSRRVQIYVKEFFKDSRIPYEIFGLEGENREVVRRLEEAMR